MTKQMSDLKEADQRQGARGPAASAAAAKPARRAPKRRARLDPDIEDLLVAATDMQRAINRELKNFHRQKDLTERGLYILYIVDRGFDRPSLLIDYFDVLPSTITVEIEKLVAAGLLVRQAVPTDRRVTQLVLTEKGKKVRSEVFALLNATFRPRLGNASDPDIRTCIDTLRRIVQPLAPATPRMDDDEDADD